MVVKACMVWYGGQERRAQVGAGLGRGAVALGRERGKAKKPVRVPSAGRSMH